MCWEKHPDGEWVEIDDHLEAVKQAEQRSTAVGAVADAYERGRMDERAAAVSRAEALAATPFYCGDQWAGAETHLATSEVIAAIKEGNDGQA
jgi:hypothetical protein